MADDPLAAVPHDPLIQALDDPFALFDAWLAEAEGTEPNDANAMALATADASGRPTVRVVLLKGRDPRGFVFYTNTLSRKGRELAANSAVALNFHWKTKRRQVRIDGTAEPVDAEEADAYFASRPRGSRLGAWASQQSSPLSGRGELIERVRAATAQYGAHESDGPVPRPPHWSGYRIVPRLIEFWQDGEYRLHDRLVYARTGEGAPWSTQRLYP